MDPEVERRAATAYEQARNARYLRDLTRKLQTPLNYLTPRSQEWLKGHPHLGQDYAVLHPLVGRVGLREPAGLVPRSFYIGPRYIETEGMVTYSWHADIARLFFQPEAAHPLAGSVWVRRTLDHRIETIVDVTDDWVVEADRGDSPFAVEELRLPAAPAAARQGLSRRREASEAATKPAAAAASAENPPLTGAPQQGSRPTSLDDVSQSASPPPRELLQGMRVPDAVVRRLKAPREDRLRSVLTMLQPDQHAMATAPSADPLIIQGHPGTGKTVVAAYRAGFLAEQFREKGGGRGKVLLIGPTPGYVQHVVGLIAPLADAAHVRVVDMQTFLREVTALKPTVGGPMDGVHDDVDAQARGLVDAAARRVRGAQGFKSGPNARVANLRAVFETLRANGTAEQPLTKAPDKSQWLRRLPSYEQASRSRRYLGLMAQCALAIQSPAPTYMFDHVIVDEAQDVSPIEWNVLDGYNKTGHWTLVGDMNQRRSDTSYSSWEFIAEHLALGSDDAPAVVQIIKRGYRSTQPILRFADKLLPKEERGALTLQTDGPKVGLHRVAQAAPAALAREVIFHARGLASRYRGGTVAVITHDIGLMFEHLGRNGWRRSGDHEWVRADERLSTHVPETARGLEFDGVVVAEPADFPKNFGRSGQLYTSLTRANRELHVVYHRPLPDPLRSAAR